MRQDGKPVSPQFWAARFAVLKQERMRETSVWPPKSQKTKPLEQQDAPAQDASRELQPAGDEAAASPFSSTGSTMATNTQPQPRRNLTIRSMIRRAYSTSSHPLNPLNSGLKAKEEEEEEEQPTPSPAPSSAHPQPHLPHLTPTGSAHMVSISTKTHTARTATAVGTVYFSNPVPLSLITSNSLKKGDVLSVSRIAGIMAAKKCPDIVPLCHPIPLTHVGVELKPFPAGEAPVSTSPAGRGRDAMAHGGVAIECKVACTGATGVEMEALTAVMGAALSVVDMCKAVDKFQRIGDVRVVLKEGGRSGAWREEGYQQGV